MDRVRRFGGESEKLRIEPGATLVNAFVKRSDLQLDMDLWVEDGSVQAFWMHAVDGVREVAIVKRFVAARWVPSPACRWAAYLILAARRQ